MEYIFWWKRIKKTVIFPNTFVEPKILIGAFDMNSVLNFGWNDKFTYHKTFQYERITIKIISFPRNEEMDDNLTIKQIYSILNTIGIERWNVLIFLTMVEVVMKQKTWKSWAFGNNWIQKNCMKSTYFSVTFYWKCRNHIFHVIKYHISFCCSIHAN